MQQTKCDYITPEDVREYLMDRGIDDNQITGDLRFSDAEILVAMRNTARKFNTIHPRIISVDQEHLRGDSILFLDGIAEQLCKSRMIKLSANDMDYDAGGVQANFVAKQLAHFEKLSEMFGKDFTTEAQAWKRQLNWARGFRCF